MTDSEKNRLDVLFEKSKLREKHLLDLGFCNISEEQKETNLLINIFEIEKNASAKRI